MNPISNLDAPAAIGPYSQAIVTGNLVYCSGQTPIDPLTMQLIAGDIASQTARVLKNLSLILNGIGLNLNHVVKTNVYLTSMSDFAEMNVVYASMFGNHRPARTTIQVAGLPLGAKVEIECIAEIEPM